MSSEESFANYPESLAEVRSNMSHNAAEWTPRDALISVLRRLDRGEIQPDALIVSYREKTGPGATQTGFASAGPDLQTTLGILEYTKNRIISTSEGAG